MQRTVFLQDNDLALTELWKCEGAEESCNNTGTEETNSDEKDDSENDDKFLRIRRFFV